MYHYVDITAVFKNDVRQTANYSLNGVITVLKRIIEELTLFVNKYFMQRQCGCNKTGDGYETGKQKEYVERG